jgi:hypothetical protein
MDFDIKSIGLAAKDIILGVGTAAAGTTGGPAAAEGVGKVGTGLDRLLGMAGVTESRGDKFDRADFAARPKAPAEAAGPVPVPQTEKRAQEQPPVMQPAAVAEIAVGEPDPSSEKPQGPYTGDTKITVDHLRSLGWSHDKVQQILSGPESTSLAALVGKETKGFRARGVEGARVVLVEGTAIPNAEGRTIALADGQAVRTVEGARAREGDS